MSLSKFTKFLKEFGTDAEKRSYGEPEAKLVTEGSRGDIIVKGLDDTEIKALNQSLKEDGYKGPGLNMGRIGELFDEAGQLKLNLFEGNIEQSLDVLLNNVKNQNKELFAYMRRNTQSMDEMLAMAETTGFENILGAFLKRKPGEVPPPEDILGGLVVMIKMGQELQFGANKMLKMEKGSEAQLEFYKQHKMLAGVQSLLASNLSGAISEYGRGLAVVRNIAKLDLNLPKFAEDMSKLVETAGTSNIELYGHQYLSLNNATARAKYLERTKGQVLGDTLMEAYINSLLSSPVTHMVNIAGNFGFQIQTMVERGLAGGIGTVRRALRLGPDDQAYLGDAMAEAHGFFNSQADALKIMGRTFVQGKSSDELSKIDLRVQQAYGDDDNLASIMERASQGDFKQLGINGLSVMTRLPGRFLATEDAYFKVVTRRRVLYREAFRRGQQEYDLAIKSGATKEKALEMSKTKYQDVMTNTPEDIKEMMTEEALKQTFQTPVKGSLATLGKTIQNPFLKVIVPFFNTPTNIINEVFDRTIRFDKLYTTLKKGEGEEFDKALSKLAIGNTTALTMFGLASGFFGDDVVITGQGPTDKRARKLMKFPQYSASFKQPDGTYRSYTFSRFDPMSGLLAMGADLSHYLKHEDDATAVESMVKAYTLSVAEYAHNLPFLQGISELTSAIGGWNNTTEDTFQRLVNFGVSKVADVGGAVTGTIDRNLFGLPSYLASQAGVEYVGNDSFMATIERVNNPNASNTMVTDEDLDGNAKMSSSTRAFYERLNYFKSRNPYFSDKLPPKLNFWGERLYQGEGRFDEFVNPVRVMTNRFTAVDKEILRLSERTGQVFASHPKKISKKDSDRYPLSGTEYNELVMLTNEIDENGLLPGDDGYDINTSLLPALEEEVNGDIYNNLDFDEDKYDSLQTIVTDRRTLAKEKVIEQNSRLNILLGSDE